MQYHINPPPQNPLTRIIAAVIAVFALIGTFMLGLVALLVIAGLALVAGLAIWLRVAWIKRRLRKSGVNLDADTGVSREPGHVPGHVIDAEYTIVSESEEQQDE